ncbi:TM0106 family RecB-like putative nuclease [Acaryochloris sp. CCMEE 5410]|uniref:TM0106 family RecB-like putative nuclease n=1 Tax=Acaryochloris sp. CCMEE 5410 TaxID=310037 RepID=UPI00024840C4|nr:TM0106 family RecB-like putative nuclease [Acaryochloris sp. CCMEE 5410]KAI9132647.1 TM0106 family RecB-like putative nuclease [Acaryochloris sp. CCMEE 5410]
MLLTAQLLLSYQRCHRQAYLDVYEDKTHKSAPSDFLNKLRQDRLEHQQTFFARQSWVQPDYPKYDWQAGAHATLALMQAGAPYIRRGVLWMDQGNGVAYQSIPDLLTKTEGTSDFGDWQYVPTDIRLSKRPKLEYQILATFHAYLLATIQGVWPEESYLYLRERGLYAVNLPINQPKLDQLLLELVEIIQTQHEPEVFIVSNRCSLCGWLSHCYQIAQQDQHLSLLPGVTPSRYPILQAHNLATVEDLAIANPTQLAEVTGFGREVANKLICQAQAFAKQAPVVFAASEVSAIATQISPAPIELYFDIEAEPSLNLAYLHGVLVVDRENQTEIFYPLLADQPHQEEQAWQQFLDLVLAYPQAPIYHFCAYEVQTVERLAALYGNPDTIIQPLLERFIDLHAHVTHTVVLPVESYTLKLIARWLGFQWRNSEANGAQSIYWYSEWLSTGDRDFLDTIVEYNEDDCQATYQIKNWLADFLAFELTAPALQSP